MAKKSKIPYFVVDMPDTGIVLRDTNKNGSTYVYYATKYYRKNGKPTCDRVCIGKKDPATGKLIPNDCYFDHFDGTPIKNNTNIDDNSYIIDYGHFLLVDKCANDCNLLSTLEATFNDSYKEIISFAMYFLMESSTINGCEIWFEKTQTYLNSIITSQRASEIFQNITLDQRLNFFKLWRKFCKDEKVLLYDTTSFSSHTRNMSIFEYGYNRDNDKLPQINMALFFGEESHLPLFYNVYEGSIADKSDLCNAMKYTDLLDINNVRYIMDRGFYSKTNIAYFFDNKKKFLMAVKDNITIVADLIASKGKQITNIENRIDKYDLYGVEGEYVSLADKKRKLKIFLYYSYRRKEAESKEFFIKINTMEKSLAQLDDYSEDKLKEYKNYFDLEIKNKKLLYKRNYEKINAANEKLGFFAFISNDKEINIQNALDIYKTRGTIEQTFDGLKNTIDIKKLKTHTQETTEGKIFVSFISLILKSYIENKLSNYKKDYQSKEANVKKGMTNLAGYSSVLLLKELTKIKLTNIFGEDQLFKTLTKKQKDIYKIYEVDTNKIKRPQ